MTRTPARLLALLLAFPLFAAPAAKNTPEAPDAPKYDHSTFSGLALRSIGPAMPSGRIVDIAVDPRDRRTWYLAVASGGVWKTTNAGTTFTPIFDDEASYSIGCVTIDPQNPLTIWVGSGENNSQRSVSMGDGVYKSLDGGKSWKNVGLPKSEHIGKIVVDPRNSEVVYVAAQGPLWAPGGDRGLYKTVDGGKTWRRVLTISENTGVTDIVLDPSNPDVLYAASYQRRRHVYTLINGGPESGLHKSTDGGATWTRLSGGLPKEWMGRAGLALSPKDPNTVYAIIEATRKAGGFFRSKDGGANWEKMNAYSGGGAQYYAEIFVDPNNDQRIYAMDVWVNVSNDGGKTWSRIREKTKHPDSHAMWIDPENSDHFLIGSDGGLYETHDNAATWEYKENLPVTQFYRVSADDALPYYHVYGGTQDNFSLGGPSRTTTNQGITNSDWYVTLGGDGFRTLADPKDPNTLYAESQHGGLSRIDKRTGEALDIQPQATGDMDPLRLNWDSPLIISPHDSNRLYFAAQYLFRSDDRGNSWKTVSGDLTRKVNRNALPVMGRVWTIDAVAKNTSTSFYGNIVSLSESPLAAGLLYAGTDDGLIQVSEDGGGTWRKIDKVGVVPSMTYVSHLAASMHDRDTVYAAFDNHKTGDFKPYVYKSTDRGRTWTPLTNNLPQRGTTYVVVEDHVDPKLLFTGTEYGLFVSQNGGGNWIQLKGGLPTIAVRDLWVQKRRNDLVVGTFGRGIYILDDYRALRTMSAEVARKEATLFPTRDGELYVQRSPLGVAGKGWQGDEYFTAENPPFGAIFTYYLKEELRSRKKQRWEAEARVEKEGGNEPPPYPTWEQLRVEERELEPAVLLVVSDAKGNVIRRVPGSVKPGFHRVAWDLRYPSSEPIELSARELAPWDTPPAGPLVVPDQYSVRLYQRVDGVETPLTDAQPFNVVPLYLATMSTADRAAVLAFQKQAVRLQRDLMGAEKATDDALTRVQYIRKAIDEVEGADAALMNRIAAAETELRNIRDAISGDPIPRQRSEPAAPSLLDRMSNAIGGLGTTSPPTETQRQSLSIAEREFAPIAERLRKVVEADLVAIEKQLDAMGAPWTPGRLPR